MKRRLSRFSLRTRSLVGAALGVALSTALGGAVIWAVFAQELEQQFDSGFEPHLRALAAAVPEYILGDPRAFEDRVGSSDPRLGQAYGGLYYEVRFFDPELDHETVVYHSVASLWDFRLELPEESPAQLLGRTAIYGDARGPQDGVLRIAERRVLMEDGGEWRLIVAMDEKPLKEARGRFARETIRALGAMAAALFAAAALQIRFALSPLRVLRGALKDYRAGRTTRIEGVYPPEIAPLVEDLNGLLDRNDRLIAQGRRRAGDLAHEMKTPVAVLRNELDALAFAEAAAKAPGPDPGRYDVAFDALSQIERQTRRQLARARVGALQGSRTPLAPTAERLRRTMLRLHRRPLEIRLDLQPDLVFRGDEEDLEELLGELTNNACLWARSALRVAAEAVETPQGTRLKLCVEDDGPGAAPEHHAQMLAPGGRLDSRRPGSGIGLAMVADLVEAYDGALTLGRADLGGLKVELLLPGEVAP